MVRAFALLLSLALGMATQVPSDVLGQARALYKANQVDQALRLLEDHLTHNSGDVDARLLKGLILSWEQRWEESRRVLGEVLQQSPEYKDARLALINVELWSDHPGEARRLAEQWLASSPKDAELKKAAGKAKTDERVLARRLKQGEYRKAGDAPPGLFTEEALFEVGYNMSQIWFSDKRSPWREQSVSVGGYTPIGSVSLRGSLANRFSLTSRLVELEAYPRIRKGTYAYVSLAASPDAVLYASHRYGGEVHQNLPKAMEGSFGFRRYHLSGDVTMYTGSLGKYKGDWLYTVRTYLVPDAAGVSKSFSFSARRYFGSGEKFLGFRAGVGASPFEVRSVNEIEVLKSTSFSMESVWRLQRGLSLRCSGGLAREERLYRGALWQYATSCTFYYAF